MRADQAPHTGRSSGGKGPRSSVEKFFGATLALVGLLVAAPAAALPSGMLAPGFGLTEVPPATNCYVDKFAVGATDTANPMGTVGTPRLTIPTSLPAGTVCEVSGGAGTYAANMELTASGTNDQPVFVRGIDTGVGLPVFAGNGIGHTFNLNGTFFILMDVVIEGARLDLQGVATAARNVDVSDNISTGCVAMFGTSNVLVDSTIHHCGDSEAEDENDFHGVFVAQASLYSWILDTEIHHNGGDAIQVGDTAFTEPLARYVFIGGNTLHDDRENAIDVKKVRDVVAISNVAYGYDVTSSSEGAAMVCHNEGFRIWFINNFVHSSLNGILCTGATGFVVFGNILVGTGVDTGSDLNGPAAILARNTVNVGIYYNTVYNWHSSITTPSGVSGSNEIIGNLLNTVTFGIRLNGMTFTSAHNIEPPTDPLFVEALALNFRLQAASPALDAGGAAPSIVAAYESLYATPWTVDIYGATRSGTFSIGASELGAAAVIPSMSRLRRRS